MTIESIVERHTLALDSSPLLKISGSPDLVKFGQHLYSDKPPVLSALTAAIYAPLHALGWSFSASPEQFVRVNLVLVVLVVGTSSAAALVALRRMFQYVPIARGLADLATLACGFGTLLLTYDVTFNNHCVAAGLMTTAFALLMPGRPSRTCEGLAGLLTGLAAAIDLPAGGAMLAAQAVWATVRRRRLPWAYVVGAVLPLMFHAVLQWFSTGSPLPVEMTPDRFQYEGSYWDTEEGQFRETVSRWQWGLELLLGPQGWLTATPALAFGILGLLVVTSRKGDSLRGAAIVLLAVVCGLLAYYTWGVRRTDFSGLSYGTRHLLAITPLVWYFAVVGLERLRMRGAYVLFGVCVLIGLAYAWAGMLDPWSRIERRRDTALLFLQRGVFYPYTSYRR
jgi:hypothetical protein